MIPMESIRDDRAESMGGAGGYRDKDEFWSGVRSSARWYSRPLDDALSPDQLTAIVRAGLESVVDLAALDAVHRRSERERNELVAEMARIHRG
jgi:hypothetical protein